MYDQKYQKSYKRRSTSYISPPCRLAATSANKVPRPSRHSLATATGSKRSSADSDSLLCHVRLWRTSRFKFGCGNWEVCALTGRSKIFQFLADAAIIDSSAAAFLPKGVLSDRRKYRLPFSMSERIARLKYPIAGRKKPHCAVGLSLYLHSRFRCTATTIISQINHNNLSCAPQTYRFFYSTVRRNRSALRKNIFSAVSAENSFSTADESFSISPIPVIPAGSDETPSKSQPVQILSASPISR